MPGRFWGTFCNGELVAYCIGGRWEKGCKLVTLNSQESLGKKNIEKHVGARDLFGLLQVVQDAAQWRNINERKCPRRLVCGGVRWSGWIDFGW